ncbi:MAG: NupC/NupG family nucleoside CNT transporter [Gammaproteobacteria bacterium]|nr:NupC/NupG family nucleoside CNT transporter [Gammaproteobacteria bacterium]MDH3767012.1 NupC/NupG family nucleoside CNT transporter [Gammaproteobacteria bacterium]
MGERLISLVGIAAIIGIAVAFSTNRRAIRFRVVGSAFALQAAIAALVLYVPQGKAAIQWLSNGVQAIVNYSNAGIEMVFGNLAAIEGFSFAVRVLPLIVFFSSLMAVLYHMRIMQILVQIFGGALQFAIGTKPVESLNAAANVFVGQTESPLVVKPYLKNLTDIQVFTIMVSGLASIAGTVLAAYASMGVRLDYLLAASFMAAPGGLLMAKLMMPDDPAEAGEKHAPLVEAEDSHHENVILAAANGAQVGVRLAVNIGAMLIAFVALIALFNGIVGGLGNMVGIENLSLERILGLIFAPLMYLLSVPWAEAQTTGALFGEKLILNEFVGFLHMGQIVDTLSPRAEAVATFSLCGFANLSSIAILLGGLGSLIPEKHAVIGRFGLKAVLAGSLSNLMSAALASLLIVF